MRVSNRELVAFFMAAASVALLPTAVLLGATVFKVMTDGPHYIASEGGLANLGVAIVFLSLLLPTFSAAPALGAVALVGFPYHIVLRHLRVTSWAVYVLPPVLAGIAWIAATKPTAQPWLPRDELGIHVGLTILLSGPVGGLTFWIAARPDRPAEPATPPGADLTADFE